MRTSLVFAFLIALGLSTATAAVMYVGEAAGAAIATSSLDAGPTVIVNGQPAKAAGAPEVTTPTPDDPGALIGAVVTAARQGKWLVLASLFLGALVWLIRREKGAIAKRFAWLATDRGGAVLALVIGALAEVAADLASRQTAPPGFVAALVSALAAGGRSLLKGLFAPKDKATTAATS